MPKPKTPLAPRYLACIKILTDALEFARVRLAEANAALIDLEPRVEFLEQIGRERRLRAAWLPERDRCTHLHLELAADIGFGAYYRCANPKCRRNFRLPYPINVETGPYSTQPATNGTFHRATRD